MTPYVLFHYALILLSHEPVRIFGGYQDQRVTGEHLDRTFPTSQPPLRRAPIHPLSY
jgi:hypothetical protein